VQNDAAALDLLLDAAYSGTNQDGSIRGKTETIDLWRTFRVSLLTLDAADVRVTGDLATVTGRQTEINATGTDTMLFTRVWRRTAGTWRLFSVTQFRDPNPPSRTVARPGPALIRLEYDLFRNNALLGRPTVTVVAGQPWSFELPGEAPVRVTVLPAGQGVVHLKLLPGSASAPVPTLVLRGNEPGEGSWTSGTTAYRVRIRNVTTDPGTGGTVRVGGDIRRPTLVSRVNPVYPPEAKAAGIGGMVIIEALIDEEGNIANATIVRSVPMLDAAALDAVRQWKYTPPRLGGKPVRVITSINVTFAAR
jgi:TonB family protein